MLRLGPWLFKAYMGLVFWTSRMEYRSLERLFEGADRGGLSLGAVWHQDILTSGFLYRRRQVVTMVSRSSDGEIFARVLRRCGYIPVRGSSSRHGTEALSEILEYVSTHQGVIAGLSVDGPRGPAFRSKLGIVALARETGVPIVPLRTWARRRVLFRSWDRMMLPLPFNHVIAWAGEPLHVPGGCDSDGLEAYRAELDRRLDRLVRESLERFP